ncbi:MAG: S26 family signal peptidase [Symploca sp. SIO2B6]|nr:S26 family signal peptidase [Symploca sp. SIO2B6]
MLPLLQPGDEVLVDRKAYHHSPQVNECLSGPQPGDIVLVDDPRQPGFHLVKRVINIQAPSPPQVQPDYWVEGENRLESTDSRSFGYVPHRCILGKVTSRFP